MTTSSDMARQGYGYPDQTDTRTTVRDRPATESLHGKDVTGVLLAVLMILGPLAAGAFAS